MGGSRSPGSDTLIPATRSPLDLESPHSSLPRALDRKCLCRSRFSGSPQLPGRPRPACSPLATGFLLNLQRRRYAFCMCIRCDVAPSSASPSAGSHPSPQLFFLCVFLLWIVLHVLSLPVAPFVQLDPPRSVTPFCPPWGECLLFLILVIVILLYVHLCIQPPLQKLGLSLIHVSFLLLSVVLHTLLEISVCLQILPSPINFHLRSTLIVLAFSSAACVYLALISISLPLTS